MKFPMVIVLALVTIANLSDSARILAVFPTPSISHQVVFRPLTEELARRGHEVIVITTDPAFTETKAPTNLTEIDVHDISYKLWAEFYATTSSGAKESLITQLDVALDLIFKLFVKQLELPEVQKIIKGDTFDLLLIEAWVRPALIFSHFFKAPVILVSSFTGFYGNYETIGAPTHPLLYPLCIRQKTFNLSFWDKINELYTHYAIYYKYAKREHVENEVFRQMFGDNVPDLSELRRNVDMLFLNVNPIWDMNRPVPPGVVYMGGIHQKQQKELPQDLKSYLDSSKHGVIFISFGTNVSPSSLPTEKIQMMISVFSQMPYDVLWKWDKDTLPGKSKNIRISKWLPQSDLLRHTKLKLFITQGGLQSTDEAITAGVPLVGIPMLGDQWFNVDKYEHLKIGVKLDLETMTAECFRTALETVLGDSSYRKNIAKLRTLMHDQPQRPLERAVWWTEHVLRHGGAAHLAAPAANITWAEYLELEIVFTLIATLLVILSIIVSILWYFVKHSSLLHFQKIKQS